MRRLLLAPVAFLALAPAAHAATPRAALTACDRIHHRAVFEGRMDARPQIARMQMRFVLQDRRPAGARWAHVAVPGFSAWRTSDPGRSRYVYTKRVQALVGPASYRVRVRFRWLAADGSVLRHAVAVSRACRQPDPRPDLSVGTLEVGPLLSGNRRRYLITVLNSGRSEAGPSTVSLDVGDGGAPLTGAVDALAPGRSQVVALTGRACVAGAALRATADAADVVDERHEDDDTLTATCPA